VMSLLVAFALSAILAVALTPAIRRLAWSVGYLDHPEARKLHTHATALLGGVAVVVASLAGWALAMGLARLRPSPEGLPLLAGGVVALALGLVDDRFGMRPTLKLAGQTLAAAFVVWGMGAPELGLGPALDALVAFVFMVGLMNAVNFLDNMDGVIAGLAVVAFAAFAWLAVGSGAREAAIALLALAGACLGFLRHNSRPASIFLGDAGSLFLGYSLGAATLLALRHGPGGWSRVGILLIVAYPLFDLLFVVVNRVRAGRPVYQGGRDHSNHRLASVLKCQTKTVRILYACGAALAASGLWVHALNRPQAALPILTLWILVLSSLGLWLSRVPVESRMPPPTHGASPTSTTSA